jgi:hypothetical protein
MLWLTASVHHSPWYASVNYLISAAPDCITSRREFLTNYLNLMKLIDRQYMARPFYGSRKLAAWLKSEHYSVNRKHVRRLMQLMGLKAIYRRPRTSPPGPGNKIYPYLLNGIQITRPNQVWCADIMNTPFLNHSHSGLPRLTLA